MINREDFEEMKQWSSEQTGWLDQSEMKGFFSSYEDDHKIENKESCGECKHFSKTYNQCNLHSSPSGIGIDMLEKDFCSYFKRKENE